jgi:hypothetical protein
MSCPDGVSVRGAPSARRRPISPDSVPD